MQVQRFREHIAKQHADAETEGQVDDANVPPESVCLCRLCFLRDGLSAVGMRAFCVDEMW